MGRSASRLSRIRSGMVSCPIALFDGARGIQKLLDRIVSESYSTSSLIKTSTESERGKQMTGEKLMTVKRITPVLLADEIESCIEFWNTRLGYEKTAAVPDGDKLAF